MDEPTNIVLTDTTTLHAVSLWQRIQHPETLPEERERLKAELNAILAQWGEHLKQFAGQLWQTVVETLKQGFQAIIDWFQQVFGCPKQPQPLFPVKDKRAWQHSQKLRAQVKRQRRERARQRTALAYQYKAR